MLYYVYLLHEAPIERPYYCKVGYTDDPLKRLDELQAGNPRPLRSWDFERRPTRPFGFRLPDKEHARRFEKRVHERLDGMGMRLRRDFNYETDHAPVREWFAELHPEKLWGLMAAMYADYLKEFNLLDVLPRVDGEPSAAQASSAGGNPGEA
jgi:hypothetical protein